MRVKDCMCREVCWVNPDTKIYEIAKTMNEIEKVELKEIKLLTYFSILEMMAQ